MDKNAIKTFAVESRRQLIDSVKYQASLIGITAEGNSEPISKAEGMETYDYGAGTYTIFDEDIKKRESLVKEIDNKGFDNVVEEVAYTWFNRIIAIRYMEVNDYLPTRTRVLSSETEGKIEPDIITDALELDLDYTTNDKELIFKFKEENKLDELFRFLFIRQCNKLNEILPGLFEETNDYLELLLNISFSNEGGIVRQLVDKIPEENFRNQIEIIGWLYQFYNSELKDETFANLKKGIKISKERIPAATQLFTPEWIVKYMVENSVGRLWLEGHPNDELKSKWKYYVGEAQQEYEVKQHLFAIKKESKILKPEDITVIDPCMGSGHILVYVFEVLIDIYVSEGYTEKDACELIIKNNLYGLDIDKRAYQLAYFAVLMKARKYNRRILTKNISPLLFSIEETNSISDEFITDLISKDNSLESDIKYICSSFIDAKEYGSILKIKRINFDKIYEILLNYKSSKPNLTSFKFVDDLNLMIHVINQSILLSQDYYITVTNPPYMGNKGMDSKLNNYLKINFKNTKNDLSTVFMERSFDFTKELGFISMINIPVWMFISSYENLRKVILDEKLFINMLHLGRGIFGSDFGTTAFVIRNKFIEGYNSIFKQLYEDKGAVDSISKKEMMFFNGENNFVSKQSNFYKIPRNPIAYWVSDFNIFNFPKLNDYASAKEGVKTANNDYFIRFWFEVEINKTNIFQEFNDNIKWVKHTKGGLFRKWYGNNECVLNYENNGFELKSSKKASITSEENFFKENITWNRISSSLTSFRYTTEGFIPNMAGLSLYSDELLYLLGFLNSNLSFYLLNIINPTINFPPGVISIMPVNFSEENKNIIESLVTDNIKLCKNDWDDYEISWDFKSHPFLNSNINELSSIFQNWKDLKQNQFSTLKENEIRLNKLFSEIYGVDIDSSVKNKHISITLGNYEQDVISFISYAVGCMFGRYSLDNEGLQFAGGEFNINVYSKFIPDDDNIIPVLDTEYFDDDIVGRFVEFVKVCFGEDTLEENLNFIAGALNKKGKTSREIIRNYFLTDFFKDHAKMYNKCPIYWQFDSGKQNAFKCLIYMHRYESDIIARVRTDYLHKTQKAIEQNLSHCENIISNSTNKSEVSKATKDKSKYIKQLDEIRTYDEALRHMAAQNIEIDLDAGVKVNYAKFQKVEVTKEGEKTKKINLLKKI